MRFRPFLLRLLLLAVFFTGAVGTPLHEAAHVRQLAEVVQKAALYRQAADDDDEAPGAPQQEADAPCSWCMAGSLAALASPPSSIASAPDAANDIPRSRRETAFVASSRRWRFASRDPPSAS